MANNILGFYGIDNYDLILYLSRILVHLNRKVLLVDYSKENALTVCIPLLEGIDVCKEIVHYNQIDFTKKRIVEEDFTEYSEIIINFGFTYLEDIILKCTEMIYVTDQQRHHIEGISQVAKCKGNKELLIKDIIHSKIDGNYIAGIVGGDILESNVYQFPYDERDIQYRLRAQYNTIFDFCKISRELREYLQKKVEKLCPSLPPKDIKKAYKVAERGK